MMRVQRHKVMGLRVAGVALVASFFAASAVPAQSPPGEVKGPNPPGDEEGVLPLTGGPDAYGYTLADQNEPNCTFQFVDISGTGTQVVVGDDVASGPIALGGPPFNLYGTLYSHLNMSSNGYLTTDLTDPGNDLSNDCPIPATPNTPANTGGVRLYPLHDDLVVGGSVGNPAGAGYHEYFSTCPRPSDVGGNTGCNVFQWNDANNFWSGGNFDLEAILYDQTYEIVYQIGPGNPDLGSGSTTGLQDSAPPSTGLLYACNVSGSIPDNTAVCIFSPGRVLTPLLSPVVMVAAVVFLLVVGLFGLGRRRRLLLR